MRDPAGCSAAAGFTGTSVWIDPRAGLRLAHQPRAPLVGGGVRRPPRSPQRWPSDRRGSVRPYSGGGGALARPSSGPLNLVCQAMRDRASGCRQCCARAHRRAAMLISTHRHRWPEEAAKDYQTPFRSAFVNPLPPQSQPSRNPGHGYPQARPRRASRFRMELFPRSPLRSAAIVKPAARLRPAGRETGGGVKEIAHARRPASEIQPSDPSVRGVGTTEDLQGRLRDFRRALEQRGRQPRRAEEGGTGSGGVTMPNCPRPGSGEQPEFESRD